MSHVRLLRVKSEGKGLAPTPPSGSDVQADGVVKFAEAPVTFVYHVIGVPLGVGMLNEADTVNEPLVNKTVA